MSSLREVKDRIASVRSTLKITSAMKLVASSKLRRAQKAIETLRPYEETLSSILASLTAADYASQGLGVWVQGSINLGQGTPDKQGRTVVVAFSSNSSMCGAFNNNAIKKALEVLSGVKGPVEVWTFGKKAAEAVRRAGFPPAKDFMDVVAHPGFEAVAAASSELRKLYSEGEVSSVVLVYNHFVSTGRQQVVVEPFLPFEAPQTEVKEDPEEHFILEPSREELLRSLIPQVLDLKLYAALLDSSAAEHAARMIAMQAATDNGEGLLSELTLEYNKGRQQKITSEILDLAGGAAH
ncbi:MAG: ATP synthase F1 subunit gamma [Bacteroidales bacterium]|nr:ATP synthase F1 subunit gamma [Bacteroidales bacterium]MBR0029714.1 ATP synthase F1 subunit gamma [Bacteroidales bacterium]MBR0084396.1 ATP synthase F1 subunit gamma [Bacteroidales bacterium]